MQIRVRQLHHAYGNRSVLKDISFTAESGQVVGLLGPNGAGKSTLLRILSGVMPSRVGVITLDGAICNPASRQYHSRIGYLPEIPPLYPDMTVSAYLLFCGRLRGLTGGSLKGAIDRVLSQCHLNEVQKRVIGELSTGFQQRVGLAQAILHDPDILIFDEPTVGLDPAQIIDIRQLIKTLSPGKIILFSTHILTEVEAICDRVLILNHGRILFDGSTHRFNSLEHTVWEYRLLNPPSAEAFASILSDVDWEHIAPDRLRFKHIPDDATAAQLLDRLHAASWQPVEATRKTSSLEQLFVALTCRPLEEPLS